ncbi:hypothetical protein PUNSTDRAFT_42396 [Punctularia strigosozonata HHB-11173 SS5]|uniref:uncharacterized protein n=1 Tax=Punctularia strigosozonata (strain HHB-11173) TaxID=741275 RepID=UPI00044182C6|nr:uncharacterized protein PUNSTDRAFT_42396 [Punctularia strigosozonata HHB-11173 SS5]EIN12946.1 hypothetical protein PUNSTDRAFT_42396 [Punctularia strigosozonata HHB-11173 SS5]
MALSDAVSWPTADVPADAPLIKKPTGRARHDYSTATAMGFDLQNAAQKAEYESIAKSVRAHAAVLLDRNRPFGQQDFTALQGLRAQVENEHPILKRYEALWPVDDLARQYWENYRSHETSKRKRGKSGNAPKRSSSRSGQCSCCTTDANGAPPPEASIEPPRDGGPSQNATAPDLNIDPDLVHTPPPVHTDSAEPPLKRISKSSANSSELRRVKSARFECHICGATFTTRTNWQGHLDAHTGHKPYVCAHNCGKTFTRKSDCKRHEQTVHDPDPHFVCETSRECDSSAPSQAGPSTAGPSSLPSEGPPAPIPSGPPIAGGVPPGSQVPPDVSMFPQPPGGIMVAAANSVRNLCNEHLDMSKTANNQEKARISRVKEEAIRTHPLLATFKDVWPVDDLIHQYIENHRSHQLRKSMQVTSTDAKARASSVTQDSISSSVPIGGPLAQLSGPVPPSPPLPEFVHLSLTGVQVNLIGPFNGGAYADIYTGTWQNGQVALKRIRTFVADTHHEVV